MKSAAKKTIKALWGRSANRIPETLNSGIELVSFDVFDTLIVRSCGIPEKVFELAGVTALDSGLVDDAATFAAARIKAEKDARRLAGVNNEVTLTEIYDQLRNVYGDSTDELMLIELACEQAVCERNPAVAAQMQAASRTHRIIITSDTYLPKWFIEKLLEGCGIDGYERLYVSSDYRKMKRDGKLFAVLLGDAEVEPSAVLHVGDHPLADWIMPQRMGINALLLGNDSRRGYDVAPEREEGAQNILMYQESWIVGGIESFVMNELKYLPPSKYDVTLCSTWGDALTYAGILNEMSVGRHIEFEGSKPNIAVRTIEGLRAFDSLLTGRNYDAVHVNTQNGMGLAYTWLAKRHGIPVRIIHSHSSWFGGKSGILQRRIFHALGKAIFATTPSVRIACNAEAGRHLFGSREFRVIQNGIDVNRFKFSSSTREETRRRHGIDLHTPVVGSIGRVSPEKNPEYQIRVFSELRKIRSDAKFLMVGCGASEQDVDRLVEQLGMQDSVIRIPSTDAPEAYCAAMDLFLLPSEHEGMPLAAVEAQCSGLQILAASHLPQGIEITDLVSWEPLENGAEKWAHKADVLLNTRHQREKYASVVGASGFSAQFMVREIEALYRNADEWRG